MCSIAAATARWSWWRFPRDRLRDQVQAHQILGGIASLRVVGSALTDCAAQRSDDRFPFAKPGMSRRARDLARNLALGQTLVARADRFRGWMAVHCAAYDLIYGSTCSQGPDQRRNGSARKRQRGASQGGHGIESSAKTRTPMRSWRFSTACRFWFFLSGQGRSSLPMPKRASCLA